MAVLLAWGQPAAGQDAASRLLAASVAAARQQYAVAFASHPQLINGPEYADYAQRYAVRIGHQFFLSAEKAPGSVRYNGLPFTDLQLAYDCVLDQVVLQNTASPLSLRLISENVEEFVVAGHRFIRLVAPAAPAPISTGFYEVVLDGPVQVLAKRAKRMQRRVAQGNVTVEFTPTTKLFVRKDTLYYPVSRKRELVKLLADRNEEVQHYMRRHKLPFTKDAREQTIIQVARYYNSLLPPQ